MTGAHIAGAQARRGECTGPSSTRTRPCTRAPVTCCCEPHHVNAPHAQRSHIRSTMPLTAAALYIPASAPPACAQARLAALETARAQDFVQFEQGMDSSGCQRHTSRINSLLPPPHIHPLPTAADRTARFTDGQCISTSPHRCIRQALL